MLNLFSRTELIFGKEAMEKLASSLVAVFGIGGVGAVDLIDDGRSVKTRSHEAVASWLLVLFVPFG